LRLFVTFTFFPYLPQGMGDQGLSALTLKHDTLAKSLDTMLSTECYTHD